MCLVNSTCGLEFQQNLALHQDVCAKISDPLPAEPDRNGDLAFYDPPALDQSEHHRVFVHTLQKPVTKLIVNVVEQANDLIR